MGFLSTLPGWIWSNVILFLLVLTVVVFVHELGHFLVARWYGVYVKAFSIGFGPELFGFYDRHGTRWRFALFPLGGYVKFLDDENPASKPSREALSHMTDEDKRNAFHTKPVGQRAAVVAAGPIANFLLSVAIFTFLNLYAGVQVMPAYIDAVVPGSAADKAGFMPGDKIVMIDGERIEGFDELQHIVGPAAGRELTFVVQRNGEEKVLKATPAVDEQKDSFGRTFRRGIIGIRRAVSKEHIQVLHVGPVDAFTRGVGELARNITASLAGIRDVITGRQSSEQMGGPILMAEVTGKVAEMGVLPLISLIAFFSANIGFLNLLPIPVLDGGHLLFYAIEAVRRKPVSERWQQLSFQFGLALIAMLMIFVNFNDLMNVWRRLTGAG